MKNKIIYIGVLGLLLLATACSDYLNQVPEEKLNEANLFTSKDDVVKVLTQIYAAYNSPIDFYTNYPGNAADEVDYNWSNYDPSTKDLGTFSASSPIYNQWSNYFNAIRTSVYFTNRIGECKDEKLTEQERTWWTGEAYFLEAYYYFLLFQEYGPVPIIDKVYLPGNDLSQSMAKGIARPSVDVFVHHVDSLLVKASTLLDVTYTIPDRCGRANASAALFLRSRLSLYAASPLYNGMANPVTGKSYAGILMIKDNKGKDLLDKTFAIEKWKNAMTYAQDAIKLANSGGYDIYMGDGKNYTPGMSAYKRLFSYPRGGEPSIETIFYKQNFDSSVGIQLALPISWSGYSGICPTMEDVNEYFMADGLLPEDDSDYQNATGFYNYSQDGFNIRLYNKFRKRDPRFYTNILFPEQYSYAMVTGTQESFSHKWAGDTNNDLEYFRPYADSQDGFNKKTGRDYCDTGFLSIKWIAPTITKTNHGDFAVSIFRYTELLLNLTESAFEYDVASGIDPLNDPNVFDPWNKIRDRVGLPHVKDAYAAAGISLTTAKLRELIHRERRVELAMEGHRYFDNRRWLDAEREGGAKHGFNIMKNSDSGFWQETVFETRYWNNKMYFMPIPQWELNRDPALTQNPGW